MTSVPKTVKPVLVPHIKRKPSIKRTPAQVPFTPPHLVLKEPVFETPSYKCSLLDFQSLIYIYIFYFQSCIIECLSSHDEGSKSTRIFACVIF